MSNDKRMQKGERTSNHILHTTIEIVAKHGLNGVTTAKLVEASGVSKSTIFHHFKTRDEVLKKALDLVFNELLNTMKIDDYHGVEEFLKAIGHSMFQLDETTRTYVEAFLSYFHEGIFNPEYRMIFISVIGSIVTLAILLVLYLMIFKRGLF
ncbi:MAG TPA: TetR/AcrR family transcriptional regulator [Virgibacillus sp.]|nr:TetR/AcrR family transcriptional regulator [Virgibacillus sp.]HLR67793.1 TetR/AcrR family transcriptional regulator [Virgibacillus sp.]